MTDKTLLKFEAGSWFRFPRTIILDYARELKSGGIATYVALAMRANNETKQCWPTVNTIAQDLGMNPKTVAKHLSKLVALGLVAKTERDGTSNVYTLLEPSTNLPQKTTHPENQPTPPPKIIPPRGSKNLPTNYTQITKLKELEIPASYQGEPASVEADAGEKVSADGRVTLLDEKAAGTAEAGAGLNITKAEGRRKKGQVEDAEAEELVSFFQEQLRVAGLPITFEDSLPAQLKAAGELPGGGGNGGGAAAGWRILH